jgi:sugar phosphate isomerase/epimerase
VITRRRFLGGLVASALLPTVAACARAAEPAAGQAFRLRYVLASALYGEMPLEAILPEVAKTSSECLDVWCRVHGNQREQITAMGDDTFAALLTKHAVRLGVSTRYPLGPFGIQDEMAWMRRFGGGVIVTGSKGPQEPQGAEAKAAVLAFLEAMKPQVAKAEELGVTIAVENHSGQLLHHPDSLRHFADLNRSPRLGLALAFHHLHAWAAEIPTLIRDLGAAQLPFIYFQEHSAGINGKVAKEIELQQLPGFGGGLDYRPIVQALRDIRFTGLVEIFMHPTPRGIPILPTVEEVTAAINRARDHVERCVRETTG